MQEKLDAKLQSLKEIIHNCSREQLIWLGGYIDGIIGKLEDLEPKPISPKPRPQITVLYGTETGNSKRLANQFLSLSKKEGISVKLRNLDQYRLEELKEEEYVFGIVSTQGEGEPPLGSRPFFDSIYQSQNTLPHLKYGILALGDTSYPLFCKAGEDLDLRLEGLGASRLIPLQKCDTDFEPEAQSWFQAVLDRLKKDSFTLPPPRENLPSLSIKSRDKVLGAIKSHILLNDIGSNKSTFHIEFEPEPFPAYLPGDSLRIIPQNPFDQVLNILQCVSISRNQKMEWKGETLDIESILTHKASILHLPKRLVSEYNQMTGYAIPEIRMDILDILKIYPAPSPEIFMEWIQKLDPITPRLYSISSSPSAHTDRIHLTVALDEFMVGGIPKKGLCSSFLSENRIGDQIEFTIHSNSGFRLPDPAKDLIMIGPGTGIAPFRSFLFERDITGAQGRNWLFFGDQHAQTDFLYQTEIQDFISSGLIHKINLAFSRDQEEKVYVWHEMLKESTTLVRWLEEGAYLYVCGSRNPMSMDVERTLLDIFSREKGFNPDQSKNYLEMLADEGRYLKDVY